MDSQQQGPINWSDFIKQAKGSGASADFERVKARFSHMKKRTIIIGVVVLLAIIALAYWWFHPPINIHSIDLWGFLILVLVVITFVLYVFRQIYKTGMGKREASPKKEKLFTRLMIIPIAIVIIGAGGWVASQSFFPGNAEKFSTILETTDGDFATDVPEVNYNEIPFIDKASAELLGNRTMGTMADYVSQFEISPLYSQINYKGQPVRVSPLNYADFFKWWANRDGGIPAYVIVNMTTQDTEIVRLENPIRYSDSDPFFYNVDRYVQLSYPFYMFDEKSFEINEDGEPYWVYPVQKRTIGLFGGTTIQRVVLCNASTGECQDLAVDEVPQWVDRVYPAELLIQQYNWSGALSGGWINSWLGQNGVKQTTPGTDGKNGFNYIAQDDDVWVYSGVTSATADNSIIGCVMINQRTAESKFYAVAGATEESAMHSAEGQVQHLKYDATFPLLLNVDGQPTYFMALKDDAGLVKMYAMVDIQRYQNVAVGDTLAATEKSYELLLVNQGINTGGTPATANPGEGTTSGTIASISPVVIDGNSHYYLILDGQQAIFDCPVASVVDVVRYKVGDVIVLHHGALEGNVVVVDAIGE
ncbi:Tat pathway signal sequence [Anaerotardibacter muris]|uniref:Tat pathway signal sequence n=1 Tax=Anaerotardibacter muris TaxID=2941505 RepID=UPI00203B219C|nr:Tat pathway signal sequence [Anaerotardibacter muris]